MPITAILNTADYRDDGLRYRRCWRYIVLPRFAYAVVLIGCQRSIGRHQHFVDDKDQLDTLFYQKAIRPIFIGASAV